MIMTQFNYQNIIYNKFIIKDLVFENEINRSILFSES